MKLTKFSNLFLLGATLAMTVNGCKTKPQGITYLDGAKAVPTAGGPFHDEVKTNSNPGFNPNPGRNPNGLGNGGAGQPLDNGSKFPGNDGGITKPLPESTPIINTPPATNATPIVFGDATAPNPLGTHDGWNTNADILKDQTIFFEFDKSAIQSSEQSKLAAVADYLRSNPTVAVRVEGNCDERGTSGYNLSLGERRALAGREYLIKLGIDGARIDNITWGETHPADPGHNDAAWAKNRRDDFIILTAPKP